jgi:2,4-dienoyl-CoA reductase-like NADH-dependent reductase (Old Yellow Enzyme family)
MADLFSPFTLKGVTLRNRIAVSPMCQYSAVNGLLNEWHQVHYAGLARGGAGVVVVEATGVAPEGRITPGCTGIWTDEHAAKFEPIVQSIEAAGAVPGLQLAHAGRKASANRPWEGDDHIPEDHPESWQPVAPGRTSYRSIRTSARMSMAVRLRTEPAFSSRPSPPFGPCGRKNTRSPFGLASSSSTDVMRRLWPRR